MALSSSSSSSDHVAVRRGCARRFRCSRSFFFSDGGEEEELDVDRLSYAATRPSHPLRWSGPSANQGRVPLESIGACGEHSEKTLVQQKGSEERTKQSLGFLAKSWTRWCSK